MSNLIDTALAVITHLAGLTIILGAFALPFLPSTTGTTNQEH